MRQYLNSITNVTTVVKMVILSTFSTMGPLNNGNVPSKFSQNPSPIFIFANVNNSPMQIMLGSGATKSLISKADLNRVKHLPVNFNQYCYLMADGYTTFEVIGTVKMFIEISSVQTSIVVGIVNSLCTDCILGMDYINTYEVNLNTKDKPIQIHTPKTVITIPTKSHADNIRILCRLINSTCIYPYQEKIQYTSSG